MADLDFLFLDSLSLSSHTHRGKGRERRAQYTIFVLCLLRYARAQLDHWICSLARSLARTLTSWAHFFLCLARCWCCLLIYICGAAITRSLLLGLSAVILLLLTTFTHFISSFLLFSFIHSSFFLFLRQFPFVSICERAECETLRKDLFFVFVLKSVYLCLRFLIQFRCW